MTTGQTPRKDITLSDALLLLLTFGATVYCAVMTSLNVVAQSLGNALFFLIATLIFFATIFMAFAKIRQG